MNDIFISYDSEDRALAKRLALTLESQGWSVWWDRDIPYGQLYDEVIAEHLAAARCVIVIWTRHSVNSHWVRTEALEAFERNTLIPALMDAETKIPLQFKLVQTANLLDWQPDDVAHPEFAKLLAHIQEQCTTLQTKADPKPNIAPDSQSNAKPGQQTQLATSSASVVPHRRGKYQFNKKALAILGSIVGLILLAGGITYAMMHWPIATRIQADLLVDRVELTMADATSLPRIDFATAQFEYFSQLTFSPNQLDVIAASPAKTKTDQGNFIQSLQVNNQVILRGDSNKRSSITLNSLTDEHQQTGTLESITIKPDTILKFSTPHAASRTYTLEFSGDELALAPRIVLNGPFKLFAKEVINHQGERLKFNKASSFALHVALGDDHPFVTVASAANRFTITFNIADKAINEPLIKPNSGVTRIEFLKLVGGEGEWASSLIGPGTIRYIDSAKMPPVNLAAHDFLKLDGLNGVTIQAFYYDPQQSGFVLRLMGEVDKITHQAGKWSKDLQLTLFDQFLHDQQLIMMVSILLWVGSVTLGAYKIYQEITKRA